MTEHGVTSVRIGLVGDHDERVPAHRAIPIALRRAGDEVALHVRLEWVPTDEVSSADRVAAFDGLWCVPASPYRSMEGALLAIRHARERRVPFLGTCGGFQHAVIEYARNVLGWADAEHAETTPDAARNVIAPLSCGLLDGGGHVRLVADTKLAAAYGVPWIEAEYSCRYGLNPEFEAVLMAGPLRKAATDDTGELRGVELEGHPFFVATLFQPERAALRGRAVPIVAAFLEACRDGAKQTGGRTA
jgi:CTP synthase (UTP-ammonia lyase)